MDKFIHYRDIVKTLQGTLGQDKAEAEVLQVVTRYGYARDRLTPAQVDHIFQALEMVPGLVGLTARVARQKFFKYYEQNHLFRLFDYVQMAVMNNYSMTIRVYRGSREVGSIDIINGEVYYAEDESGEGEAACIRLLGQGHERVEYTPISTPPRARNVSQSWLELATAVIEGETRRPEERGTEDYEDLVREAAQAILNRQLDRAQACLARLQRLFPNDPMVQYMLRQLSQGLPSEE